LAKYDRHNILEYTNQNVNYSDFVNKDLIHFSNDDNIRSLPSLIDGQKPSQRKILYACFKKDQRAEIKVAQLASYVSEHTAYKHGEKSLEDTIVGMAQRFAGSNNIYLLHPSGNFGFRKQGGDEHASSRYIFTNIEPITHKIFRKEDESILNFIEDEGEIVEPEYYYPIIPMILVNGGHGVGTGFSTNIPQYNPLDICENLLRRLKGKEMLEMDPWYHGFTGEVKRVEEGKYKISGKFELINDDTVKITEIPIKGIYCWIDKYLDFVNGLVTADKKVANVVTHCGNNKIDIDVEFKNGELQKMVKKGNEEIEKFLKLSANMSVSNLYLYNHKNEITHYESPIEIMEEFFEFRLNMYAVRRKNYLKVLSNQLELLKNKVRFIEDILSDKIVINKKKKAEIIAKLEHYKYPQLSNKVDATEEEKSYRYLTDMGLFSLTLEKIEELNEEYNNKKKEFDDYNSTTEVKLWERELEDFVTYYKQWLVDREEDENDDDNIDPNKKNKKSKKIKTKSSGSEKKPTKINKKKKD
jgi:DNA topoisomerase-2